MISINEQNYRKRASDVTVLFAILTSIVLFVGAWQSALILAGFLVVSLVFLAAAKEAPALFQLLFALAMPLNAVLWAWDLFKNLSVYDELTHAVTILALTAVVGFYVYKPMFPVFGKRLLAFSIVTLGMAMGALWEIVEWVGFYFFFPVEMKGLVDTILDLISDAMGAAIAAHLVLQASKMQDYAEPVPEWRFQRNVNINYVGAQELMQVAGISEGAAHKVVEYRYQHGPFSSCDDLDKVFGLDRQEVQKLKNRVICENTPGDRHIEVKSRHGSKQGST